jgi:hypothetical protein
MALLLKLTQITPVQRTIHVNVDQITFIAAPAAGSKTTTVYFGDNQSVNIEETADQICSAIAGLAS